MAHQTTVTRMIGFTQVQWEMLVAAFDIGSRDAATKLREVLLNAAEQKLDELGE